MNQRDEILVLDEAEDGDEPCVITTASDTVVEGAGTRFGKGIHLSGSDRLLEDGVIGESLLEADGGTTTDSKCDDGGIG